MKKFIKFTKLLTVVLTAITIISLVPMVAEAYSYKVNATVKKDITVSKKYYYSTVTSGVNVTADRAGVDVIAYKLEKEGSGHPLLIEMSYKTGNYYLNAESKTHVISNSNQTKTYYFDWDNSVNHKRTVKIRASVAKTQTKYSYERDLVIKQADIWSVTY